MRLAAASLAPRPPSPKLSGTGRVSLSVKAGRRNIDHKRSCLWTLGWHKAVPRDLMNGAATVRLEAFVERWPEQKLRNLEESKSPGARASPEEPERLSKPLESCCLCPSQVRGGCMRKLTAKGNKEILDVTPSVQRPHHSCHLSLGVTVQWLRS